MPPSLPLQHAESEHNGIAVVGVVGCSGGIRCQHDCVWCYRFCRHKGLEIAFCLVSNSIFLAQFVKQYMHATGIKLSK